MGTDEVANVVETARAAVVNADFVAEDVVLAAAV